MILAPNAYWRRSHAARGAYLIDGAAYFRTFREAAMHARRSIYMLGWDFNSRTMLVPEGEQDGYPTQLVPFLNALVEKRRDLHVNILNWDFSMVYAAERESLPVVKFDWKTDRRIHFSFDSELPFGVSHHQKIVVIDDTLAFIGGLDITTARWDEPDHAPAHPLRTTPDGKPYGPFHDVQMVLTGQAAASLGRLCRERWYRATGKRLPVPPPAEPVWPASAPVHFENVTVALSRNFAAYKEWPAIDEVLQMHKQAFQSAERFIFVENEYLTSHDIADVLAGILAREQGPEVVLVLPREQSGWLEQSTMGVLRARIMRRLREADRHGRLRMYCPVHRGAGINLHSKVFVVDDRILKIGSSNLSNRSMGVDSEIDLVLESAGDAVLERGIARCRETLLAEHLGVSPEAVQAALEQSGGSLIQAIERLRGGERTLEDLEGQAAPWLDNLVPQYSLLDPERPMNYAAFVLNVASEMRPKYGKPGMKLGRLTLLIGILVLASALAGNAPPGLGAVRQWFAATVPAAPWALFAACIAGALLFVPALPLVAIAAVLVEPLPAFAIGLTTSLAGAMGGYATGRNVRRERVRRLAGRWAERVFPWLERDRFSDLVAFRLFSGVPYGLANLLAGAARTPAVRYFAASAVALALMTFTVVAFAQLIGLALTRPEPLRITMLLSTVAAYAWISRSVQRAVDVGGGEPSPPPS